MVINDEHNVSIVLYLELSKINVSFSVFWWRWPGEVAGMISSHKRVRKKDSSMIFLACRSFHMGEGDHKIVLPKLISDM